MTNKRAFKVLQTPNFYFPLPLKGKKFIVEDSYSIHIFADSKKNKEKIKRFNDFMKVGIKHSMIFISGLSELIWNEIKERKLPASKNHLLVPIMLSWNEKSVFIEVDLLKMVVK